MAGTQHTQTHPKFIYTFLAMHRDCIADGKNTVHVAADTLVDACEMLNDMGYISATWKGREENTLFIQKCENNFIWRFIALSTAQPRVITIVATSEQEARQKNQLIAIASQGYDLSAPAKSGAGIGVLEITRAHNTRLACFFVPHSHTLSMVGCTGAEKSAPGSLVSGYANPVQSTTSEIGVSCGGYYQSTREAANMATIPTLVHSQTAFLWRFVIFGASDHQIIHVTAWTEREARNRCPSGCVAVFAARIRQEVCHA